jgi:hypothetical protein
MPKGRMVFWASGSPGHDREKYSDFDWFQQPEATLEEIARQNNAEYVPNSLVFAPGGRIAEALFDTFEPTKESGATLLHQLAFDLDAIEARLLVPEGLWRFKGAPEQSS